MSFLPLKLLMLTLILLLWVNASRCSIQFLTLIATDKDSIVSLERPKCPIGFSTLLKNDKETPLCYQLKDPEIFADRYKDCAGNLYTSELLQELNVSKLGHAVWTEYRSIYPGGIFYDWSFTRHKTDLTIRPSLFKETELCLIYHPVRKYKAEKCNKKYSSYCVIKPYMSEGSLKGCEELKDSFRFQSPDATCLTKLPGDGVSALKATWNEAQDLCKKNGASLLNRGWKYSNHPEFYRSSTSHTYPLGIRLSAHLSSVRYDTIEDNSEIPQEGYTDFCDKTRNPEKLLGSLKNNVCSFVHKSYIFEEVICELRLDVKTVSLEVAIDVEHKINLSVNDSLNHDDVYCLTDSVKIHPTKVIIPQSSKTNLFTFSPKNDGYYWCICNNTTNYNPAQSNKVLFVRDRESLVNTYSIKFQINSSFQLSLDNWKTEREVYAKKLKEYLYYRTKYVQTFGELNSTLSEDILKDFKNSHSGLKGIEKSILSMRWKRIYLNEQIVLVHVELNPDMKLLAPGSWDGIKVLHMKAVYYCKGIDSISDSPLGGSQLNNCQTYKCIGDYNEGVQWNITVRDICENSDNGIVFEDTPPITKDNLEDVIQDLQLLVNNSSPVMVDDISEVLNKPTDNLEDVIQELQLLVNNSSPVMVDDISKVLNKTKDNLEDVIQELQLLVNNSSPVMVDDISEVLNKVDDILEVHDSLDIPSQLLHLLDSLGSILNLNGSRTATTVRNNIALVLADAAPSHPVRGLKIATRDSDVFTDEAFEIFSGNLNDTDLHSDRNEVVVNLPPSLSKTSRRVSFVVFRNDRAFRTTENVYSVNSRILSVKIENVTKFENDEVIDIHLNPIARDIDRNESRACAYWQFLANVTGYWAQEGCRVISATRTGMLNTCRCTHLTHFAEVLFPRAVFSQRNEDMLELLTIIGCCLSIFGLTIVGVTAVLFRSWRRDFSNKIWLQLCIGIFLLVLSFLIVIFAKFKEYSIPCMLIGVVLHYSVLSSFCWMLVAAVLSYRRLVLVFTRDAPHKLLRASAFAWGAPCAIVGILLSTSLQSYNGHFDAKSPTTSFCYPSGLALWISVYAPIAIILVINWILFALIVRSVFSSRGIKRHGDTNEALRCASVSCLLVFLFGLPWFSGLFAFNVIVAYIFTLTATYQGLILFLFLVLGNKKTRDLWLNKSKIK